MILTYCSFVATRFRINLPPAYFVNLQKLFVSPENRAVRMTGCQPAVAAYFMPLRTKSTISLITPRFVRILVEGSSTLKPFWLSRVYIYVSTKIEFKIKKMNVKVISLRCDCIFTFPTFPCSTNRILLREIMLRISLSYHILFRI